MSARSNTPKRQPLSEADMAAFRPRIAILEALEAQRSRLGVPPEDMTVLDWGCGRGELTLWLRRKKYRAFGIDVNPQSVDNGRVLARQRGLPAEDVLLTFDENYRAPLTDGTVDFTSSDQVLEHVSDLASFGMETARVLKPSGAALHVYPAHRRVIEGHLKMPFVQFLPKSPLRFALIRACVAAGIEPKDWNIDSLTARERARRYYDYSCENTFYRTPAEVETTLRNAGFQVRFDVRRTRGVQSRPWAKAMFAHPVTASLMSSALMWFGAINLECWKIDPTRG